MCREHSLGYLAHLSRARLPLGARLASVHNVSFLVQVAEQARAAILTGHFSAWQAERLAALGAAA